jgi:D-psicose/D-tagatose/L-ribulose 3-epimerase
MNVKIGMNMLLWGAQTQVSHIPVFENIASAGFDGVEISVVGQDKSDLKIMRGAIADLGVLSQLII